MILAVCSKNNDRPTPGRCSSAPGDACSGLDDIACSSPTGRRSREQLRRIAHDARHRPRRPRIRRRQPGRAPRSFGGSVPEVDVARLPTDPRPSTPEPSRSTSASSRRPFTPRRLRNGTRAVPCPGCRCGDPQLGGDQSRVSTRALRMRGHGCRRSTSVDLPRIAQLRRQDEPVQPDHPPALPYQSCARSKRAMPTSPAT